MSQPQPNNEADFQAVVASLQRQVGEKAAELAIVEGRLAVMARQLRALNEQGEPPT